MNKQDQIKIYIIFGVIFLALMLGMHSKNLYEEELRIANAQKDAQIKALQEEITELQAVIDAKEKVRNREPLTREIIDILTSYAERHGEAAKISDINDDVRSKSGLTVVQINNILDGSILEGHGEIFLVAEMTYGINARFLLSVSAHETGWWRSGYARKRNNIFGWGAYTHNPDLAHYFQNYAHCILHVAERLNELYISETGKYFRGATVAAIGQIYATDPKWAQKVIRTSGYIEKRLGVAV